MIFSKKSLFYSTFIILSIFTLCVGFKILYTYEQKKIECNVLANSIQNVSNLSLEETGQAYCMSVPILNDKQHEGFSNYKEETDNEEINKVLDNILLDDVPVPCDIESRNIYISSNIDENTEVDKLKGKLSIDKDNYNMYFAPDEAFNNLSSSVESNHTFKLILIHDDKKINVSVIFTTLPVMKLDQIEVNNSSAEDIRDVINLGYLYLWNPVDSDTGEYSVTSSYSKWHIRGGTSVNNPKKSYKISLRKENGDNNNISLLDMPADDDWILNNLWQDDTKIRERLSMDLWEEMRKTNENDGPMSQGKYVELVINGKYNGIYLLQTRVDRKYLSLDKNEDYLVKGKNWLNDNRDNLQENIDTGIFSIKYMPRDSIEGLIRAMNPYYEMFYSEIREFDMDFLDLDNLVDTSLLFQYGNMTDNYSTKNIYLEFKLSKEENYVTYFIPWDTDMSFGLSWDNNGFVLNLSNADNGTNVERDEVKLLRENGITLIDDKLKERWTELRENVFSTDYVTNIINSYSDYLNKSGVLIRDGKLWRRRYDGEDNVNTLKNYVERRFKWLDQWYGIE